jgi:AraC-like DNA-binding protein
VTVTAAVRTSRADTHDVEASERVAYWEDYNSRALVGLRCSSYAEEGLHAAQTNVDLGDLRVADISGNAHVIERPPDLVRAHPRDAVFACLLLEGSGYFFQAGECVQVAAGDLLLYDTDRAYLYGFTGPMRQLLVDVPRELLDDAHWRSALVHVDAPSPARPLTGAVASSVRQLVKSGTADAQTDCIELLNGVLHLAAGGGLQDAPHALALLTARRFIRAHLDDPGLDVAAVGRGTHMSPRQLHRVFSADGDSVSRCIWRERLEHAHGDLSDPRLQHFGVGEIAARWGFANQAHFSRAHRARYGSTPSAARAGFSRS